MKLIIRTIFLSLLAACVAGSLVAQTARRFPDTRNGIFVFADQLPNYLSDAQTAFAASHLVGTQKIPRVQVDAIRTLNPNFILLHYRLGCEDGPELILIGNDWTNWKWQMYVNLRNDWFWLNAGARIHNGDWNWQMMDIRQLGADTWTSYWREQVADEMRQNGADGVFADSFDPLIGGFDTALPPELDYPGAITGLYPQINNWAQAILDHFAATPERFLFVPNYGALVTGWNNVLDYTLCDGAMVEGFGEWGTPPLWGEFGDWQLQMNRCLRIVRAGKALIAQHYLSSAEAVNERMFVLGMHLLIKGDHTFINMMAGDGLEWYPEYAINLGASTTPLPASVDDYIDPGLGGLYRRNFQNGMVLVNPTGAAISVPSLGATLWRALPSGGGDVPEDGTAPGAVAYTPVTSISLPSNSAAILMLHEPGAAVSGWREYD
ncbi:MAG: putative glycoside hydrolase [bacterium]|nr:putative glycoside hydrolase [Candidatus Sumerlaeota bacterium]